MILALLTATQPINLPEIPPSWTAFLAALGALITTIGVLVGIILKMMGTMGDKVKTLTGNTQTLAAGVLANSKAINQSPASPNVPGEVEESARAIRNDPTVAVETPERTDPEPPRIQT